MNAESTLSFHTQLQCHLAQTHHICPHNRNMKDVCEFVSPTIQYRVKLYVDLYHLAINQVSFISTLLDAVHHIPQYYTTILVYGKVSSFCVFSTNESYCIRKSSPACTCTQNTPLVHHVLLEIDILTFHPKMRVSNGPGICSLKNEERSMQN